MKHKHTLTKSKTALLVIDVQDKFAPVIPEFDNLVTNVTRLVLTFEMFKMPVVVTEQYPEGLGNTVEKIEDQFTVLEVVEKMELAATENGQFMEKINASGCDTFVVCGIETHVCINQTVLGLLAMGKTVHVVADAVGSRHSIDHETGLRKMENAGALIATTEMVMFELAERAGTDSFKNIQTMVKASKIKTSGSKAAKKVAQQKDDVAPKPIAETPKPAPVKPSAAEPAPSTKPPKPAPVESVYNDVVDIFDLPGAARTAGSDAAAAQKKPGEPAPVTPAPVTSPLSEETEAVDLVDLELASAAREMHEKKAAAPEPAVKEPAAAAKAASKSAPSTVAKPATAKGATAKAVSHSSSDIDAAGEINLEDMLSSIDKIDTQKTVTLSKSEVDKDIADLEDIIKVEEKSEKDMKDLT
jgi:nicotinamidase-related amidase